MLSLWITILSSKEFAGISGLRFSAERSGQGILGALAMEVNLKLC